jgi:hypothetical protein
MLTVQIHFVSTPRQKPQRLETPTPLPTRWDRRGLKLLVRAT